MTAQQQNQIPTAPAACRALDRTGRFIARIDAHLPSLANDAARRGFLARQLERWQSRYARFIATQGASEFVASPRDPPHPADFLLTITALAARAAALGPKTRSARCPACGGGRRGGNHAALAGSDISEQVVGLSAAQT